MKTEIALFATLLLSSFSIYGAGDENPELLMCERGAVLFSEDFDPGTVSARWHFKGEFALRDGALVRTEINREENQRVFLKDPEFHNTIIQFDFKFAGETTNLRMVMGSGGHYNSVVEVQPSHFQINTPDDKSAGLVPSHLGQCAFTFGDGKWHTMTVEYWGDEIVAHVDGGHIVLGAHPIIDRTREYFAFQFDRPSAAIDNVRVWEAKGQTKDWAANRSLLVAAQASRPPVKRTARDQYQYVFTNVKSRLTLTDEKYRQLVKRNEDLKSSLHARYPDAFRTHKELQKAGANRKKELKESDPEFKQMESAVHKARRAEDVWVIAQTPALKNLPKHRVESELALARRALEKTNPAELAALVAETARLQAALEKRFPEAFASVEMAVEKRKALRQALNDDAEFKKLNREVSDSWQAIKQYENAAEPGLAALEAAAK
jgi:hypothetical protein